MSAASGPGSIARLAAFVVTGRVPPHARRVAATAVLDTVGVTLAGASEPASRIVAEVAAADGGTACTILGTPARAGAAGAALANGTAAHALDFDDMCFVSLAHPSAPLVPALLAAGELTGASGSTLLDGYVVGFEIEARLGALMNPRHYERGWHCTSTLGTIGAAAGVCRVLGLDETATRNAIAIAATSAAGLKENFGTMTKPFHAGLAAQNGVLAAQVAARGLTASAHALDGPQGYLRAMDSQSIELAARLDDLGARWEIGDTGITVKLYPSCAGTHPTLDAVLDLIDRERVTADEVERVDVGVDAITPTVLIHDRPASGLEAKFSMPFCVAAALIDRRVDIATFDDGRIADTRIQAVMPRVRMVVDASLDPKAPPLTEARVRIVLRDGRDLEQVSHGARGYPANPASDAELDARFMACATRAIPAEAAVTALGMIRTFELVRDVRTVARLASQTASPSGPARI